MGKHNTTDIPNRINYACSRQFGLNQAASSLEFEIDAENSILQYHPN